MINIVLEIIEQFVRGRITLVQVARQSAVQDFVEPVIDPSIERAEIGIGMSSSAGAIPRRCAPLKILSSEQQVRQDDARGKNIGTLVGDLKVRLLGAHVIGFAGDDFAFVIHQRIRALWRCRNR